VKKYKSALLIILPFCAVLFLIFMVRADRQVERPPEIRSKRLVIYDTEAYKDFAKLWKAYYREYPSEFAYANWMYAARYAGDTDYSKLLEKGLKKFPSNPVLLYLAGVEKTGMSGDPKRLRWLEKSVSIDPNYVDPWFSLIIEYMITGDDARADSALQRILASGYMTDDILDYNYNVLAGLDSNAILITNGDNDTYPAWALSRVLNFRRDVSVVNISLLNTDWYPLYVQKHGAPQFITLSELQALLKRRQDNKDPKVQPGFVGDSLTVRLIEAAKRVGRPLYFALTLNRSEALKPYCEAGRILGLALLVTPSPVPYPRQLEKAFGVWLKDFRSGGLDSWRLHNAKPTDAGRFLVSNYAWVLASACADSIRPVSTDLALTLFQWYRAHVHDLLSPDFRRQMDGLWCERTDIPEIRQACETEGSRK
jgi:hypothetical protein